MQYVTYVHMCLQWYIHIYICKLGVCTYLEHLHEAMSVCLCMYIYIHTHVCTYFWTPNKQNKKVQHSKCMAEAAERG